MHHKPSNRVRIIKRLAIYTGLTLLVVSIVTFIIMFILGYRFDSDNNQLEQYSFFQFGSSPSGATVTVDEVVIGAKTPNKTPISAGSHSVVMWRDGYETWQKTVDAKAGIMTWLNYTLLVPKNLVAEPVADYASVYQSMASPKGHYMLVQEKSYKPTFNLVDLGADLIQSTELTIPNSIFSEPTMLGVTHNFQIEKWDEGGRFVLIKHTYSGTDEWLVLDTQDADLSKNITRTFNAPLSNIAFYGTSGNLFYALDSNDIRKLDLSLGTISRTLVSNVTSFEVYESNIITYVGYTTAGVNERVVGIYRDGDEQAFVLRTITSAVDVPVYIATAHYFNEDYVAIVEGKKVDILSGSYPNTENEVLTSLKIIASFDATEDIHKLMFSPIGQYVFVQSDAYFASYDLEYQIMASSTIEGTGAVSPIRWLDENYIWSDRGGSLTIREFDGANVHTINPVLFGQDVTLTHNGRYLYSINKTEAGAQLQRVLMILP